MNKEIERYLDVWSRANQSIFSGESKANEYSNPENFIEGEQTGEYRYRMHKYVKTFNSSRGFSVLYHWYNSKVQGVNTIESTDGGNLLVNDIVVAAESFIPIFGSYWKSANPGCDLTKLDDTNRGTFNTPYDRSVTVGARNYSKSDHIADAVGSALLIKGGKAQGYNTYHEITGKRKQQILSKLGQSNKGQKIYCSLEEQRYKIKSDGRTTDYTLEYFNNLKETKTMNTYEMKLDAKSSIKLATDLAKGRTALATVHGLITKVLPIKFSWFARLTGKDKAIVESPFTKLAGACVAHAIALQFDNSKVAQVTKLAQDAALVEVASLVPIEDFVAQLTETVTDKLEDK